MPMFIVPNIIPQPLPPMYPELMQAAIFISSLAVASVIDICKRVIPNRVCLFVAAAGLIFFSPAKLFGILAASPLFIAALCKQGSIGGGDIKLTAAAGFVLGFENGVAGLVIGLAAMLIYHVITKIIARLRSAEKKTVPLSLPMAPFLSIGFAITYLSGI